MAPQPTSPDAPQAAAPARARGLFYGWYIVAGAVLVMGLCITSAGYLFGVFLPPLVGHFGWTRAQISTANSLCLIVISACGPFVGRLTDRFGPRAVIATGAVVSGIGFATLGLTGLSDALNRVASPLTQFYAASSVFGAGVACAAFVPLNTIVANWFVRRRGLALGVTSTGMSTGALAMIPLAGWLIDRFGWRTAYAALGALMVAVVLPLAVFVMKRRPADLGLLPDGDRGDRCAPEAASASPEGGPAAGLDLARVVRTYAFWALAGAYVVYGLAQSSVMVHSIVLLIEHGWGAQEARGLTSLLALASTTSKVVVGYLADHLSPPRLAAACYLLLGAGTGLLAVPESRFVWLYSILCGTAMGGIVALQGTLVARQFGVGHFGSNFGLLSTFLLGASAASPVVSGYVYDLLGSYSPGFAVWAMAQCIGAALVFTLSRPVTTPVGRIAS
jgi:MFS family permease